MKKILSGILLATLTGICAAVIAGDILSFSAPLAKLFLYLVCAAGWWVLACVIVNRFLPASPKRFLLALALIAGLVRVAWIAAVPNRQVSDFAVYQELSAALASGKGYALTGPAGQEDLELYIGTKSLPYRTA